MTGCQHKDRTGRLHYDEIKNGNDQVVGAQCRICLVILWGIGDCDGCDKKQTKLLHVVVREGQPRRYCSIRCHKAENARRAAEASVKWNAELEAKRAASK